MPTTPPRSRFLLLGAGKVGTAISLRLVQAGYLPVGVWSRSAASAERASELLGCTVVDLDSLPSAELCILGVTDQALTGVAERIAGRLEDEAMVVHFAGAVGVVALERHLGPRVAALHPVQAFASVTSGFDRLPGSTWGVTTSAGLDGRCMEMIRRDLEGEPVIVPERDRALWHAAAVMTSNGSAALLAAGAEVLRRIGIEEPARVLGPLALGTLENVIERGASTEAVTGPIVRGDRAVVERHLDALSERAPDLRDAYAEITRAIVTIARSTGRISHEQGDAFLDLLI